MQMLWLLLASSSHDLKCEVATILSWKAVEWPLQLREELLAEMERLMFLGFLFMIEWRVELETNRLVLCRNNVDSNGLL